MKTLLVTFLALATLSIPAVSASAAISGLSMSKKYPVHAVQADCYAVGEDKAAAMGGQLAKASPDTEGGQPVCRVVIVVPGKDGERPKRVEVVIPQ